MHSIILVAKNELVTKLTQKSFWVITIGMPLFILAFNFGLQLLTTKMVAETIREDIAFGQSSQEGAGAQTIGFVDQANILVTLPLGMGGVELQAFPDEASAQDALNSQTIAYYYVIPEDFMETGALTVIENEFRPFRHTNPDNMFSYALNYNLSDNILIASLIQDPVQGTDKISLSPNATTHGPNTALSYLVPILTMFIFYSILTVSGGLMLESVAKEKATHLMEILLLSISPRELIAGKIFGLSMIALIQMALWAIGGVFITGSGSLASLSTSAEVTLGGQQFDTANTLAAFTLPPSFFLWGALYLLLGYLLYATAMSAIGALMPHNGESSTISVIASVPLLLGALLSLDIIRSPHGELSLFLSLFPLTSPISMMTRLAASQVPLLQILLSLGLLTLTTYGMLAVAAHVLRPEAMLSEAPWAFLIRKRSHER